MESILSSKAKLGAGASVAGDPKGRDALPLIRTVRCEPRFSVARAPTA
jgi:hypothetical protein